MLNKVILLILISFSLPSCAQTPKDYSLTKDRNAWLTSNSGAALTTFNDSNTTQGCIHHEYCKPEKEWQMYEGKKQTTGATIESIQRLSSHIVVSGAISYDYSTTKDHIGTAFYTNQSAPSTITGKGLGGEYLPPFNIIISTPGKVKTEEISLAGAIGWQATEKLSFGAKTEYSTANTARQKDLRYANFRMNLATSVGIYTPLPSYGGGAALSLFYRCTTEDIAFSRAGTTDIIHTSLIDYANGLGINETYSGDGFTDDTEQPLFSEYKGLSAQINIPLPFRGGPGWGLFLDALYARRTGYYGKLSQYTIRHTEYKSDCYSLHSRLTINAKKSLHLIDAQLNIENLTNHRTNYLSKTVDGITSYTYYAPTKTANKVQATGHIAYILYPTLPPFGGSRRGALRLSLGTQFLHRKQTAWLYPESLTVTDTRLHPFATIQRSFPLKEKALLTPHLAISTTSIDYGISVSF